MKKLPLFMTKQLKDIDIILSQKEEKFICDDRSQRSDYLWKKAGNDREGDGDWG